MVSNKYTLVSISCNLCSSALGLEQMLLVSWEQGGTCLFEKKGICKAMSFEKVIRLAGHSIFNWMYWSYYLVESHFNRQYIYFILWRDKNISLDTKKRLGKAVIESVACYWCEVWLLKTEEQRKLLALEMDYLRSARESGLQTKVLNTTIRS